MRICFSSAAVAVVLFLLVFPLSGCMLSETKPIRETRRFYNTHINAPVEVDLTDPKTLQDADSLLVSRLIPVDMQLTALERSLSSLGSRIDQATVEGLMRRFPWLSSIVLINPAGETVASMPEVTMKRLDYSSLLDLPERGAPRDLRLRVQDTELGPEVILARPFYSGADLQILLAASFDFSALIAYASDPQTLMVRSVDLPLWTGSQYGGDSLGGVNWAEELTRRSYGSSHGYSWLARYVGYVPLIFATHSQ